MTFYQELQLNQAGSKNLLKKSETTKEKMYHILVYLIKIAVTMVFCFFILLLFSASCLEMKQYCWCGSFIMSYGISKCGFGNPHWTIYDAFGYVFCNNGRMSASCKSAFTGTGNAVKYCCTGSVDIFWMS